MPTQSIESLQGNYEPYTARASLEDGGLQTVEVTGDRNSDAFSQAAGDSMGKMDFLHLLTTQLKYQDPMEPADNGEFVAQLAQFSQLETMTNVSSSMGKLEDSFNKTLGIQANSAQSITNSSAVSLIGKEVRIRQKEFDWMGDGVADFKVHMGERSSVVAQVLDDNGEVVADFEITEKDATNAGSFSWDGRNANGIKAPAGAYSIRIAGEEEDPSLYSYIQDTVAGVRYDATGPVVKVSGKELPIGNILEVNTRTGSSSSDFLNMGMSEALALVGKNVKYADKNVTFTPVHQGNRSFNVDFGGSTHAKIVVRDGEGNVANTYMVANEGANSKKIDIPLDDKNGTGGTYTVSIEDNPNAFFYKEGPITGVTPTGSGVALSVNGIRISASDILELSSKSSSVSQDTLRSEEEALIDEIESLESEMLEV